MAAPKPSGTLQVAAYHNNNYRPLMWPIHRPHRAAIFRLSRLLKFPSATQDESLVNAWNTSSVTNTSA